MRMQQAVSSSRTTTGAMVVVVGILFFCLLSVGSSAARDEAPSIGKDGKQVEAFVNELIAKHQEVEKEVDPNLLETDLERFPRWSEGRMAAGFLRVLHLQTRDQQRRNRVKREESDPSASTPLDTIGEPWFKPVPVISASFGFFFSILFIGYGYRCYHLTMFFSGFIPVTGFFYLILTLHTSMYTGVAFIIGLFIGTAFGIGTLLFNPAAHAALGGFCGILIAAVLATTIESPVFDWIAVLLIPVTLASCGLCLPKHIIVFATSFLGGYGIMAAIDYFGFGAGGFSAFFPNLLSHFENMSPNWMTWLLVVCTLGLTVLGMVAQYCYSAKEYVPQPIIDLKIGQTSEDAYEDLDAKSPKPRDVEQGEGTHHQASSTSSSLPPLSKDPISIRLQTLAKLPHPRPPPAPTGLRDPPPPSTSSLDTPDEDRPKQRLFD